ncbi:UbiA prenyltransferase family-domain-containing protein [Mycena rosella]|uniref:UbiA prenyltransferase family-domain-containing protein n=1 Tax=Mycena rosella TaxID=1033263 RepID=A0AAD7BGV2_MYCRO|nr:UbiA prenyltransferase family-domain-containing protein [Mycena rosella]
MSASTAFLIPSPSISPPMADLTCDKETTLLITHHEYRKDAPKFPLGLPTGTILMFWPFAWGLTMAAFATRLPLGAYALHLGKALVGAFLLRSSACTINDIFDREMDAGVERTRNRPLASGRVSVLAAVIYLVIQYTFGVTFFYFTEEGLGFWVALFQLICDISLLKRVTHWPQAWLGFAMNFGFVTAWISASHTVDYSVLSVAMASCWCWTMVYDIKDDVKMGVRSTAILFGTWIRPLLIACAVTFVLTLAGAGLLNGQGMPYFVVSVGGTAMHLVWQFLTVNLDVPKSCWRNFNRNGQLGWIVWAGLAIDYIPRILPGENTVA